MAIEKLPDLLEGNSIRSIPSKTRNNRARTATFPETLYNGNGVEVDSCNLELPQEVSEYSMIEEARD
ncbi:hypothetical protein [Amycolatopsis sp. NBC_00438]|uniref:hypothetical protein n=1 Tax=Amycolatopsis sp. NBC_00438 TaxID=2903558 RepID=UPI002E206219